MSARARVVVGYDGSPDADAALAWAVDTARLRGRALAVLVVGSDMDPVVGQFHAQEDLAVERLRSMACERLEELSADAAAVEVRRGPVVPTLVDATEDAAMLVVGSTGHGLAAGSLTGSVSQHAARHARCPVVVVRPCRSPHAHRIVVGIDGSAESQKALRFACDRAQVTGEAVIAAHGFDRVRWLRLDGAASEPVVDRMDEAERFVAEQVAGLATEFPDVEIATEAVPVRAAELLVSASAFASLVVVGSRGRDAFSELLLGSVSQHVLGHAECPVAVVR